MINVRQLLKLTTVPRIGPQKIRSLISHFKSTEAILQATARELISVPGIDKKLASNIVHHKIGDKYADEQLKKLDKIGGRIITIWDKEYPDLLKKIYDPPPLIFTLGNFNVNDHRSIAIVGTRHPTQYGYYVTEHLTQELAKNNITIVSGLARGIDTIAHSTALKYGTRTIAVIGSGLDVPYPPENKKLLERISELGVIISEVPMGSKPDAPNFPRRNRIISGLSLGTVVIESGEDGGAMITASTALDQGREVFAVPGNITEKRSNGTNKLIKEGRAKLISNIQDIFDELSKQLQLNFDYDNTKPTFDLTKNEQILYQLLSESPIHIDELAEKSNLTSSDVLVNLLSLEFKGAVRQLPGKMFVRF